MMDIRCVGCSGLTVFEICLGTMTFGRGTDAASAHSAARRLRRIKQSSASQHPIR
jgi:aryl-alcohol dehydrogenase-like predicted oxidoreductase